ncbi:MAG: SRPBCC family protein [Steroidobacter sp.]
MNDFAVVTEPGSVRLQRVLPGPIERVWSYLTDSELRGQWLAAGETEMRVGGRVELRFHHADLSPQPDPIPERYKDMKNGHTFFGKITHLEPPRQLSYTWGESYGDSEVTFELTPQGADVLLTLTHRRLSDRKEMASVAGGWHTHIAILIDRLNNRTPPGFWSAHAKVEGQYEERFASARGVQQ